MPPSEAAAAVALDARLYRRVRSLLVGRPRAESAVLALIRVENAWALGGAAAVLVDRGNRRAWVRANIRVTAAFALAKLLSRLIGRRRPNFPDCPPARAKDDRQSFPSTHATVSFAAAAAVPPLVPAGVRGAIAAATSVARVLLGEHYPSDIAAGALLGVAVARALED